MSEKANKSTSAIFMLTWPVFAPLHR